MLQISRISGRVGGLAGRGGIITIYTGDEISSTSDFCHTVVKFNSSVIIIVNSVFNLSVNRTTLKFNSTSTKLRS